jgi:hypothetical protein
MQFHPEIDGPTACLWADEDADFVRAANGPDRAGRLQAASPLAAARTEAYRRRLLAAGGGRSDGLKAGEGLVEHRLIPMKRLLLLSVLSAGLVAAEPPKGEPTDAEEAAAQAAAEEAGAGQGRRPMSAPGGLGRRSSRVEQAWEQVLQGQLGNFYLPLHKRDKIAGKSNAWDFVKDDPSCCACCSSATRLRGYTQPTRKALAGKANVHRAPANCGPPLPG